MFRNYLTIAWRNLVRTKGYSIINIAGLATGMAAAMLIGLWCFDELSFNKSFDHYDRLGQVYHHITFGEEVITLNDVPGAIGPALKDSYTGFEAVASATQPAEYLVGYENKKLSETGMFAEPAFLSMFSLPIIQGTGFGPHDIHSIMLSKRLAAALVGDNAIGKLVRFDKGDALTVTGVFEDFPVNSAFADIKMLMPLAYYHTLSEAHRMKLDSWEDYSFQCFVLLEDRASLPAMSNQIKHVLFDNASNDGKSLKPEGFLLPMQQWHFGAAFEDGQPTGRQQRLVSMFGMIGIFVLALACINFMNLSTARSERRAKEVGIRKVMGSGRKQLTGQFLSESLVVVTLSFLVALCMASMLLPFFNIMASKQVSIPFANPYFIAASFLFIFITALAAGSYPALYLSSFNPAKVLKGVITPGRFSGLPRKAMVVFQFTTSITLIIGTVVVFMQIRHAKNRPVGFDREGIIHIQMRTEGLAHADYNLLRDALLTTGAVTDMAKSDYPITGTMSADASFTWPGKDPSFRPLVAMNSCSHDFPATNGFQFIAGRDFSRALTSDSLAVIINEKAASLIGGNAIGKHITFGHGKEREIIGIIKDQVRSSPFATQSPHVYYIDYNGAGYLTLRLNTTTGIQAALQKIERVIKTFDAQAPFEYTFQDDDYAHVFQTEEQIGQLASTFSVLAIFISCIGIFGLAAFSAGRRIKEIGIRKILGASVSALWQLLSREFIGLVIISIIVASPLAYYLAEQWLQQYDYRIEISWLIFVATGLTAIMITLVTVSYQALKAALMNPVKSLRTD